MDKQSRIHFEVRPLLVSEWEDAMQLVWDTFLVYEAPEYAREGIEKFHDFIRNPDLKRLFVRGEYPSYGAFCEGILIGVLALRGYGHVSLLFVEPKYHHQGVATALLRQGFSDAWRKQGITRMTVHAAPYAVPFYHKLGFRNVKSEVTEDGIRYTPMMVDLD